jgi:hypothetical protein
MAAWRVATDGQHLFHSQALRDGDGRDGDAHSSRLNRKLRALSRRGVRRKPSAPLFVHPSELGLVSENEGRLHDILHRAPGGPEDGLDVAQALPSLFLNRLPDDFSSHRVERPLTRHEYKAVGTDCLAVSRETGGCVISLDEILGHERAMLTSVGTASASTDVPARALIRSRTRPHRCCARAFGIEGGVRARGWRPELTRTRAVAGSRAQLPAVGDDRLAYSDGVTVPTWVAII